MNLTRVCSPNEPETVQKASLSIYKGTTFRITVSFKQNDGVTALSLTDIVVTFNVVDLDNNTILTVSSDVVNVNGSTVDITDIPGGVADVIITDEDTALFTETEGYWWMTLTLLNGDKLLRGRGNIYIKQPYE